MYNYLIAFAASLTASIYFIDISMLYYKLKLNFKPFNCVTCLSVWLFLLLLLLPSYLSLLIFFTFFTGVSSAIISKLLDKL